MASKLSSQYATQFFLGAAKEVSEQHKFFTLWPVTRKQRVILGWAIKGEKAGIHRGKRSFGRKVAAGQKLQTNIAIFISW